MYNCKYCGKEFEKHYSLAAHVSMCNQSPNYDENRKKRSIRQKGQFKLTQKMINEHPEKYIKKDFIINCPKCGKEFIITCNQNTYDKGKYKHYCSRKCANSHIVSDETKLKIGNGVKTSEKFKVNNKLAIKNRINTIFLKTNKIINCRNCEKLFNYKTIINGKMSSSYYCSEQCKQEYIHKVAIQNGGFKEGSVKNFKSGWYKGIHCDSSWELAFLIYNFDNDIKVERCKEIRYYIDVNGEQHEFHPDFIINNQIYEIKGLQDINYINKQNYNKDIKFLFKNDIQPYIEYAQNKYGENFIDLYDKKDKT